MNLNNLDDYGLGDVMDWAGLILGRVYKHKTRTNSRGEEVEERELIGYILVIDRRKFGDRAQWKFAGGHKKTPERCERGDEPDRTPLDTAVREFEGETGIKLPEKAFDYAGKWLGNRGDHWKILFTADLAEEDIPWMHDHHKENEGEEPGFFTREAFDEEVAAGKFMPEHYDKMVEFGLIIPMKQVAAA